MKEILMSIRPEWVCKILNGEKTIEIRKTAPKCELPVTVYIYCTKAKKQNDCSGKVIARFTMRKVEDVLLVEGPYPCDALRYDCRTRTLIPSEFYDRSCLLPTEVTGYGNGRKVYAWHISDLQIFDEPKDLSEFYLKKAPQSWCYVEEKR